MMIEFRITIVKNTKFEEFYMIKIKYHKSEFLLMGKVIDNRRFYNHMKLKGIYLNFDHMTVLDNLKCLLKPFRYIQSFELIDIDNLFSASLFNYFEED